MLRLPRGGQGTLRVRDGGSTPLQTDGIPGNVEVKESVARVQINSSAGGEKEGAGGVVVLRRENGKWGIDYVDSVEETLQQALSGASDSGNDELAEGWQKEHVFGFGRLQKVIPVPGGEGFLTIAGTGTVRLWKSRNRAESSIFFRASNPIVASAVSGDGGRVLLATRKNLFLKQLPGGRPLPSKAQPPGRSGEEIDPGTVIRDVAFFPEESAVAVGFKEADGSGRVTLHTIGGEENNSGIDLQLESPVVSVSVSGNGNRVAASTEGGTIQVWNRSAHEKSSTLSGRARQLRFCRDGTHLLAFRVHQLTLWNVETGEAVERQNPGSGFWRDLSTMPDSDRFVLAQEDRIQVYEPGNGIQETNMTTNGPPLHSVGTAPEGSIIMGGTTEKVYIWKRRKGELKQILGGHTDSVRAVAVSPGRDRVASAHGSETDSVIRIWKMKNGKRVGRYSGGKQTIQHLAYSRTGDQLIAGTSGRRIAIYDAASPAQVKELQNRTGPLQDLVTFPASDRFATVDLSNQITIRRCSTGEQMTSWNALKEAPDDLDPEKWQTYAVAVSADGQRFAVGLGNRAAHAGRIQVWSVADEELQRSISEGVGVVQHLEWVGAGERLFSLTRKQMALWNTNNGGREQVYAGAPLIARYLPGGQSFVSTGDDVLVIRNRKGLRRAVISYPGSRVLTLDAKRNGFIAAGLKNGLVCVWTRK